ncbi:MAG: rRNA maturation RNase YbeY [Proteobacteria bacterium]|nr:rRNA maturation RNase YbeY [Pseudomonadota bacterium]
MAVSVEISISDSIESGEDDVPEPGLLQQWAAAAYLGEASAIVSIRVSSSAEIQQLNKDYRHKDKLTNVLSFPMQLPEDLEIDLSDDILGDIALCASVINDEAVQQSKSKEAHWAHMVVHGMLHLQGYDHISEADAAEMEQLEIDILEQLDFPDPYRVTETA